MAYNTKNIIRDAAGAPVPQFYNPASDAYEALQGRNGANRVELYGPDGNPIGTTSGKLNVRASEIEALAGALTDAAVTDPAASASVIALSKGLLKQLQGAGTGAAPVQLTGSYATIDSNPVVGAKTVSTTAAELFAGASRLVGRYTMIVYNESSVPVYWGPSGVTTSTGFPLLPQDSVVFQFNPSVATAIYFIAGSNAAVRVVELA